MSRLANIGYLVAANASCDRATVQNSRGQIKNAVLIHSLTNVFLHRNQRKAGRVRRSSTARTLRTTLDFFSRGFREPDGARRPDSGFLPRFIDVNEKRRYSINESKKMRISKIRFSPISAHDTLPQRANEPEGRPRSTWNEIAIRLANTGFPSVSSSFHFTLNGVDGAVAIGAGGDCGKLRKLFNCASRRDDGLGIPGTFVK